MSVGSASREVGAGWVVTSVNLTAVSEEDRPLTASWKVKMLVLCR